MNSSTNKAFRQAGSSEVPAVFQLTLALASLPEYDTSQSIVPPDRPKVSPEHLEEWRASGIDDDLIFANLVSFAPRDYSDYQYFGDSGDDIAAILLGPDIDRRNDGRVRDKDLRRIGAFESGGWAIRYLDPISGDAGDFLQFKPDRPRETIDYDQNGKPKLDNDGKPKKKVIKYESLASPSPIFLKIPDPIAAKIAAKNGLGDDWEAAQKSGSHFWEWVKTNPQIPIEITEGAKKAAALLSRGIVAIGVLSITTACVPKPKDDPTHIDRLLPGIELFYGAGRSLTISFDQDPESNPQTIQAVAGQVRRIGAIVEKNGCIVSARVWDGGKGKGIDDLIAGLGDDWETNCKILPLKAGLAFFWGRIGHHAWEMSKAFTAKIEINQKYLEISEFKDGEIYCIKSGLGSGKTTCIKQWIEGNRSWLRFNRLFFLGYRNNLLLQNCAQIDGLLHIQQFGEYDLKNDPTLWAALCIDSLIKFLSDDLDGAVIILDEVVSVIRHLLFSQTEIRRYRQKIIALFSEAIKRAKIVICLDGNLADWAVNFITSLAPDKPVNTIKNVYLNKRPDLLWIEGAENQTKTGLSYLARNSYKGLIDLIGASCHGAKAVCSDSQTSLETIDSLLTGLGYNVFRIDSKTAGDAMVASFLKNSTDWLKANPIDYLLYSPTAESGLDIPITEYFKAHYCLFFGVLDVDSVLQMIARVRDDQCPKFFWAREWTSNDWDDFKSFIPETLERAFYDQLRLDLHRILSGEASGPQIISEILQSYERAPEICTETAFFLMAQWNYERSNYRQCLEERLLLAGYPFQKITVKRGDLGALIKDEKEKVQRLEAEMIWKAETKPLSKIFPKNLQEQYCQKKAFLLSELPGIDSDPIWGPDFIFEILSEKRAIRSQSRRYWLLTNLQIAGRLEMESFKKIHDQFFGDGYRMLWLDRNDWGKVWALSESRILSVLNHPDPDRPWLPTDPEIVAINAACKKRAPLSLHLGKPGKTDPLQYVGKLLGLVGAKWAGSGRKVNGEKVREYRLDLTLWGTKEWDSIQKALTRKWAKYFSTDLAPIDWENVERTHSTPPFDLHSQYSDPQNQSGQGFEEVAPESKISDRFHLGRCHPIRTIPDRQNSHDTEPAEHPYTQNKPKGEDIAKSGHPYTQNKFRIGDKVIFHDLLHGPREAVIVEMTISGLYRLGNGVLTPPSFLERA